MLYLLLAGAILGPLLVARVRHLPPAPGGIVVRPDAPKLNMAVVVDADPNDVVVKPLVATLTGQRPQPAVLIVEAGAADPTGVDVIVRIQADAVLATPEALDRIAAEVAAHGPIAVYPWVKTTTRMDSRSMFPSLFNAMGSGAFGVVRLPSKWTPVSLRAYKPGDANAKATVYGGGHVVAQGVGARANGARNPVAMALTVIYIALAVVAFGLLVTSPGWASFGVYVAYVFSLSMCLRQVGKFARLSAVVYPATLVASIGA